MAESSYMYCFKRYYLPIITLSLLLSLSLTTNLLIKFVKITPVVIDIDTLKV